jgi:hypothetical protein
MLVVRQLELDFVHGVKVLGNANVLGAKGVNYTLLHKYFGCESTLA